MKNIFRKGILVLIILLILILYSQNILARDPGQDISINNITDLNRVNPGNSLVLSLEICNTGKQDYKFDLNLIVPPGFKVITRPGMVNIKSESKKMILITLKIDSNTSPGKHLIEVVLSDAREVISHNINIGIIEVNRIKLMIDKIPEYVTGNTYIIKYIVENRGNSEKEIIINVSDNLNMEISVNPEKIRVKPGENLLLSVKVRLKNIEKTCFHKIWLKPEIAGKSEGNSLKEEIIESRVKLLNSKPEKGNTRVNNKNNLELNFEGNLNYSFNKFNLDFTGESRLNKDLNFDFDLGTNRDSLFNFYFLNSKFAVGWQNFKYSSILPDYKKKQGVNLSTDNNKSNYNLYYFQENKDIKRYGFGLGYKWNDWFNSNIYYSDSSDKENLLTLITGFSFKSGLNLNLEKYNQLYDTNKFISKGKMVDLEYQNKNIFTKMNWSLFPDNIIYQIKNKINFDNYKLKADLVKNKKNKLFRIDNMQKIKAEKSLKDEYYQGFLYKKLKVNNLKNNNNKISKNLALYDRINLNQNKWVSQEIGSKISGQSKRGYIKFREHNIIQDYNYKSILNIEMPLSNDNQGLLGMKVLLNKNLNKKYDYKTSLDITKKFNSPGFQIFTGINLNYKNTARFKINLGFNSSNNTISHYNIMANYSIPLNFNYSADTGKISGNLIDENNKGVSGIKVRLNDITGMTDPSGYFEFKKLPPGEYYLSFSYEELSTDLLISPELPQKIVLKKGEKVNKDYMIMKKGKLEGRIRIESDINEFSGKNEKFIIEKRLGKIDDIIRDMIFIKIKNQNRQYIIKPEADEFLFNNLVPGKWELHIENNDLFEAIPQNKTINIVSGERKIVDILVKPKTREIILKKGGIIKS
ncbi:MAG: hypothetical protein ACOCQS_01170 [Bacillota bacterium]